MYSSPCLKLALSNGSEPGSQGATFFRDVPIEKRLLLNQWQVS
jgi:hypothetical protein